MEGQKAGLVVRVGKRGTVVIPQELRAALHIDEGTLLLAEARPEGLLLRPAVAVPRATADPWSTAHQLLTTAPNLDAYIEARAVVANMGIDPARIAHTPPPT